MRESWIRYLAWVLVVSFPCSMVMADATSAMLIANGSATVNGSPVERATAVFPGDKVQTGPNAMATLTSQGSAVTVGGNSSLVFSRSFVNVLCGTAMVATSHGMAARVSNLLVQPVRGVETRFQITQNEGQLQIIAREGTLAIDNGTTTTSLQPGRMLTAHAICVAAPYADDQAGSSPTGDNPPDNGQGTSKKKGAPGPPGPSAPTAGGTSTGTVLLVAGGALAGGAIIVCVTTQLCTGSSATPPTCASSPCTVGSTTSSTTSLTTR